MAGSVIQVQCDGAIQIAKVPTDGRGFADQMTVLFAGDKKRRKITGWMSRCNSCHYTISCLDFFNRAATASHEKWPLFEKSHGVTSEFATAVEVSTDLNPGVTDAAIAGRQVPLTSTNRT